ncbi:MAG: hypothetical protein QM723_01785 [Myxococcaceae bacterium]
MIGRITMARMSEPSVNVTFFLCQTYSSDETRTGKIGAGPSSTVAPQPYKIVFSSRKAS